MNEQRLKHDIEKNKYLIPFKIGFQNSNNLCYMNSILTCLCQVKELMLKFGSSKLFDFVKKDSLRFPIFKSFFNVIIFYYENKYLSLAQDSLVESVFRKNVFQSGQQNDANEFLVLFLSWLQDEIPGMIINSLNYKHVHNDISLSLNDCLTFLKNEFKIKMRQTIVCSKRGCSTETITDEIINLNVRNSQSGEYFRNINSCIQHYFQPVFLNCICPSQFHRSSNKSCTAFYCETCLEYVDARKQYIVISLPKYLVINLVIFNSNQVINFIDSSLLILITKKFLKMLYREKNTNNILIL